MPIGTAAGQPPYDPADLQKLYGYLNQVRSSPRLAREAARNVEVMWLKGLWPGYRVPGLDPGIGDFRKEKAANRDFVLVLHRAAGRMVAIDGAFFHGDASTANIVTRKWLAEQVAVLEQDIAPMRRWRRTTRRRRTRSSCLMGRRRRSLRR